MERKYVIYFTLWFVVMLTFGFLTGDGSRMLDSQNINLNTLQSTELYFRNIRSNYYHLQEEDPSGFDIYSLKKYKLDSNQIGLTPLLLNNWRQNLAYIYLRPNIEADEYRLVFGSKEGKDTLFVRQPNSIEQYKVALKLYNELKKGADAQIVLNCQASPLFSSEVMKGRFLIVLEDYFKLVGVL